MSFFSHFRSTPLASVAYAAFLLPCSAASISLGHATSGGVTAVITPDSGEVGQMVNVYMGAVLNGRLYLRGANTGSWQPYLGGAYPVAISGLTLSASNTVTVVDFDISSLAGLDVYVAYGANDAAILQSGHLAKVHSIPQVTTSAAACDTTAAPAGISYSQSGNTVTVTTNGKCVALPTNGQFCSIPAAATPVGVSVLTATSFSSFSLNGLSFNIPGYDLTAEIKNALSGTNNATVCTINAPSDYGKYSINMNVCYDITALLSRSLAAYSSYVTVTPPVTETLVGSVNNSVVSDCFTSGANTIVNATTKEVWLKQSDGTYKKP